jgi:hypothetical protein
MEVIIEWHRVHYICLSLTHLNVHIDKGSMHVTFPHSWLVARITRQVPLVEQKLLTLPEHMSSAPFFSEVRVTQFLVLCVCFADRCLSFCTFFFLPLCCLFFFDIQILVVLLVSSNSSYRIYTKKLIKLPNLPREFSQYYWGTLHNCLFFQ